MSDPRPNVILIIPHDLGKELGCYGRAIHSPHLDAFAQRGIRFDNAFCTSPCCSPARGCLYTGQCAHTNGMMGLAHGGWPLPLETRTLVDHWNDAGYETIHVGYQHERLYVKQNRYQVETYDHEGVFVERAVDTVIDYLKSRRNSARPFYLNVGSIEVHACKWGDPDGPYSRVPVYGKLPPEEVSVPDFLPDTPAIRDSLARFQACIHYYDSKIGLLFEAIRDLGYADDTIVLFITDHGISGSGAKGTLWDRGTEIACMMQLPGEMGAGSVVEHLIPNIDIAPTLLEATGVPVPSEIEGRSFWPLLNGGSYEPNEQIFTERNYHGAASGGNRVSYDPMRSVRTREFHYIRNFDLSAKRALRACDRDRLGEEPTGSLGNPWPGLALPKEPEELYRIIDDPQECRNLAGTAEFEPVRQDLADRLDKWMEDTDDPLLQGAIPMPSGYDPENWGDLR